MLAERDTSDATLEPTSTEEVDGQLSRLDVDDVEMPNAPDFRDPGHECSRAELPREPNRGSARSPSPNSTGHAEPAAEQVDGAAGPENQFSEAALRHRILKMLTGEGERPRASGEPSMVSEATNGLILAAVGAFGPLERGVWRWWEDNKAEIKRCCAPARIDKEESLGYLLADVLGRPLLLSEDARSVGKRATSQATAVEKRISEERRAAVAAARRAARGAGADIDGAQREAAAQAARARVLGDKYDLTLPARTVGAKRRVPPRPLTAKQREAAAQQAEAARVRAELMQDTQLAELTAAQHEARSVYCEVLCMCSKQPDSRWAETWRRALEKEQDTHHAWRRKLREWEPQHEQLHSAADAAADLLMEVQEEMALHDDDGSTEADADGEMLMGIFDRRLKKWQGLSTRSIATHAVIAQLYLKARPPLEAAVCAVEDAYFDFE